MLSQGTENSTSFPGSLISLASGGGKMRDAGNEVAENSARLLSIDQEK